MYIRVFAVFLFLSDVVLAQQPPIVPDQKMTPGDTFEVTVQDLCVSGYTKKVRNVPVEMKREVYREYGITSRGPGDYEVDHLIALELGGLTSIKNLWPESQRTSPWNAQVKDRLEGKLHGLVCDGKIDLKTAQQAIASNWMKAYKLNVSPNPPISRVAPSIASESPLNSDDVWSTPKARSIGSPVRDIMVKPNGANTSPKKRQSKKGICQRTVRENADVCE
jgi:hypothetical protein